jgi:tripartite-type tricarboxylate transporter receptor subunit TctC
MLPNVLVVNPALPVRNVRELVALGRAKNGELKMASAGIGSVSHLAGAAFASAGGFKTLHVPYKGGAQGVASVVAGETDFVLTPAPAAMSLVAANRLRLLGHSMAASTQPLGPTPSIASELAGFEFASWIGLMAPKGLPPAVTSALVKAVAASVQRAEVQKSFEANGAVAHAGSPDEFRSYLAADIEANRKAIAVAGVQAE